MIKNTKRIFPISSVFHSIFYIEYILRFRNFNNSVICKLLTENHFIIYGKAQIDECRMVEWFKEHEGYEVKEIEEAVNESDVGGEAE